MVVGLGMLQGEAPEEARPQKVGGRGPHSGGVLAETGLWASLQWGWEGDMWPEEVPGVSTHPSHRVCRAPEPSWLYEGWR